MPSPFVILLELYGGEGDDNRHPKFQAAWVIASSSKFSNLCISVISNCFELVCCLVLSASILNVWIWTCGFCYVMLCNLRCDASFLNFEIDHVYSECSYWCFISECWDLIMCILNVPIDASFLNFEIWTCVFRIVSCHFPIDYEFLSVGDVGICLSVAY